MFNLKKKNDASETSIKKKFGKKKILMSALAFACIPNSVFVCSAAEGDLASVVTSGTTVVTSVMTTIWTFITGNEYLAFSVAVSVIAAVIMLFKRMVGASRR